MKIRNDFVSNSSSSSYIVAVTAGCTNGDAAQDIAEKYLVMTLKKLKTSLRI